MKKRIITIATVVLMMLMTLVPTMAAGNINLNTWYTDSIVSYNTDNDYTCKLSSAGYISVGFQHEYIDSNSNYWYLKITNTNGEEVLGRYFAANKTEIETAKIGLPAGTYNVKVEANTSSCVGISYKLRVNYTSNSNWEKESNNDASNATVISLNQNMTGSTEDYYDKDYYKASLVSDGVISITFQHEYIAREASYWYVTVSDTNGNKVLDRYIAGNVTETKTTQIGLPAGTYYVCVEDGTYDTDIPYTICLNYTKNNNWEKETNNSGETANMISVNKDITGTLEDYYDKDYFKVSLSQPGYVSFVFEHAFIEKSSSYWYVKLSDTSGNDVFKKYIPGNVVTDKTAPILINAGTYYISIEDGSYDTDMPYTFCLKYASLSEWLPYVDVSKNDWYYDSVFYNHFYGTMTGMDKTHFGPYNALSRAQFAVILHRICGEPEVAYASVFPDVGYGTWYSNAVIWANSEKIITGYTNGHFGPADNITREQIAVMMYRYADYKDYSTGNWANLSKFGDYKGVSSFATNAMKWAVGNGIITGKDNGTRLDPHGSVTRAECATIIMRFMQKYA